MGRGRQTSRRPQFIEQRRIVGCRSNHRHVLVILGRGADHRRAADIDVLDDLFEVRILARSHLFKFVQVHHDHIDGGNIMRGERCHVLRLRPHGEHAAGHSRMDRLHAAVEHFREARQFGDILHGQPGILQRARRSSGGDQFDSQSR